MGGMCNFDFGVALCRRIWNSREEQGSRDGYTVAERSHPGSPMLVKQGAEVGRRIEVPKGTERLGFVYQLRGR